MDQKKSVNKKFTLAYFFSYGRVLRSLPIADSSDQTRVANLGFNICRCTSSFRTACFCKARVIIVESHTKTVPRLGGCADFLAHSEFPGDTTFRRTAWESLFRCSGDRMHTAFHVKRYAFCRVVMPIETDELPPCSVDLVKIIRRTDHWVERGRKSILESRIHRLDRVSNPISATPGLHASPVADGRKGNVEAAPRLELGNSGFANRCLTTWLCRHRGPEKKAKMKKKKVERETGFEPATATLARWCSTS